MAFLFVAMLLVCCSGGSHGVFVQDEIDSPTLDFVSKRAMGLVENSPQSDEQTPIPDYDKKIIRDGRIGLRVSNLGEGKARIDELVGRFDSYYAGEFFNDYSASIEYDLTIRIPSQNFDAFIAAVENGDGKVLSKSINARDVTEQFFDLETRLASKRMFLARYRELLARANMIPDILDIEERIRGVQEEIESTEGRLRLLNNQINYSTLDLKISEPKSFFGEPADSFRKRLGRGLSYGWEGLVEFVIGVITIWPLWLILAVVAIPLWRSWRKKKAGRN